MYFLDNWYKFVLVILAVIGFGIASTFLLQEDQVRKTEQSMGQLSHDSAKAAATQQEMVREHTIRNNVLLLGWGAVGLFAFLLFLGDLKRMVTGIKKSVAAAAIAVLVLGGTGCARKPFEPNKLEVIKSNEVAFLLPLTGDGKKQESSDNQGYFKENLVFTQQVKIPQQWVQTGHESMWSWNGEWRDAATLIRVDTEPATREWTADPNSGTSNKNEAIWVMTSDQVEFSTGWTITARIVDRDDAVKFLHNYPNGSLKAVMDGEVRSKLQAEFGLAVTDLPMHQLRTAATPVIVKVTNSVKEFFKSRGITITNIGITGGFVYKDKSIIDTMVKVFNAEQEKSIAIAKTNAQEEQNKAVILEAQGKADAIMKTKKAEADGIKLVADARAYEVDKVKADQKTYLSLKQLELQKELLLKWDGVFPRTFFGGAGGSNPQMLLQMPPLDTAPDPNKK